MTAESFPPLGYDLLTLAAMVGFGFFGFPLGIITTLFYVHWYPLDHAALDAEMWNRQG